MNRAKFFAAVRTSVFGASLSQPQVRGMEVLLDAAAGLAVDEIAYVLATAYHETAATMQPIAEYGKGRGRKYGVPGRNAGRKCHVGSLNERKRGVIWINENEAFRTAIVHQLKSVAIPLLICT